MKYRIKISDFKFGVPAALLAYKYNKEQFEIVGITQRDDALHIKSYTRADSDKYNDLNRTATLVEEGNYVPVYMRLFIKFR